MGVGWKATRSVCIWYAMQQNWSGATSSEVPHQGIKASRHQGTSEPEENSCLWWTSKLWFWPVISRWHFCICFPTEWERGLYLWTSARLCSRKSRVYFMKLPLCSAGMEYLYIAVSLVCRLRIHHCWRNAWKGPWSLLNIAEGTIIPYAAALFSMRPVLISYCP